VIIFLAEPSMEQNTNLLFVFLCGIIGVTGMLIPGLSGSYLLVLLGNYKLLISETIHRISDPKYYAFDDIYFYLKLFITFLIGHIVGIITFSRIIKWLLNNFKNQTFSLLTGFITGSLLWIWPWQSSYSSMDKNLILFSKISFPDFKDINDLILIAVIICGGITLVLIEKIAKKYRDV
jgi:putative membrane protein